MRESKAISTLRCAEHGFLKAEGAILIVTMFGLLAVIFIQVVCRYVLHISTPWAEETARYLFIWMSYVGAGRAFAENAHIEIDLMNSIFDAFAGQRAGQYASILAKVALVATAAFLVFFGCVFSQFLGNIARLGQRSAATDISMVLPMSGVLVGTVLMVYHAACRLFYPLEPALAQREEAGA